VLPSKIFRFLLNSAHEHENKLAWGVLQVAVLRQWCRNNGMKCEHTRTKVAPSIKGLVCMECGVWLKVLEYDEKVNGKWVHASRLHAFGPLQEDKDATVLQLEEEVKKKEMTVTEWSKMVKEKDEDLRRFA